MKHVPQTLAKFALISGLCIALSGCASLRAKTKKAPCGPVAGMTDPCGNRVPVNQPDLLKNLERYDVDKTAQT